MTNQYPKYIEINGKKYNLKHNNDEIWDDNYFKKFEKEETNINKLLSKAASFGTIRYIQRYLNMGADINYDGEPYNETPFSLSATSDTEAAKFLRDMGADINKDKTLITGIIGYDVDRFNEYPSDYYGIDFPPMEYTSKLIELGINLNDVDENGHSPIEFALLKIKYPYVFEFLLKNGADINFRNSFGKTILDVAIEGKSEYIEYLKGLGAKTSEEIEEERTN